MAVRSHFWFVAGVCVVAAGLLMGGGAVAVADPGSSGSAAHGANASGQPSTGAKSPKDDPGGVKTPKDDPRGTDTKDEKKDPSGTDTKVERKDPSGTDTKVEKKDPSGTDTKDEKKDSGPVAAVPNEIAAVPNEIAAGSNEVAPVPDVAAPVSEMAPVPDVAAPVSEMAPVSEVAAPVPNVVGPVSDVSALVQDLLASVAGGVVPPTQLQSDLYAFLLGITGVEPVVDAWGRIDGAALSTAVHAWVASELSLLRAFAAVPGVPVAGFATWAAPLGGLAPAVFCTMTQACRASSLAAMSPLAPSGATAMGVQLFVRSGSGEALRSGPLSGLAALSGVAGLTVLNAAGVLPVSLAALAALALPGAGGLTILTAAGVRIGYRQAKAGFAVRAAGIAGFARPGAVPLGVVRSGSVIVIRPRALPVVRAEAFGAGGLLDKVA